MAGESRLSEQESGFNMVKTKGIRLSDRLSQAKARREQEKGEWMGNRYGEKKQKTKVETEREGESVRDRLTKEGGGEPGYE